MAYKKQHFIDDEYLYAAQLNHMENGIADAVSAVNEFLYVNPSIRAIAHRGYSAEAPENTLAAYRLAREKGFIYAECDVAVTSDGVPVLLHDNTIDRTSNGTGNIADLTLAQVRALDFGSWYSTKYAGEKIPTLEEFVIFCKWNGLHPYIEIKSNVTAGQIPTIVDVVRRYDMLRNVTWISFSSALLEAVKAQDVKARLGYVVEGPSSAHIAWANSVKTDSNEVFIDMYYTRVTDTFAAECAEYGIPLEVWTINSAEAMAALDPYVSGFTSDIVRANVALYGVAIPESGASDNIVVVLRCASEPGVVYHNIPDRALIMSTVGTVPYTSPNADYNNKYYPIAVPSGATSVSMTRPANTQWAVRVRYLNDGVWASRLDSGWLDSETYVIPNLTSNEYLDIGMRFLDNSDFPVGYDTSGIKVSFA